MVFTHHIFSSSSFSFLLPDVINSRGSGVICSECLFWCRLLIQPQFVATPLNCQRCEQACPSSLSSSSLVAGTGAELPGPVSSFITLQVSKWHSKVSVVGPEDVDQWVSVPLALSIYWRRNAVTWLHNCSFWSEFGGSGLCRASGDAMDHVKACCHQALHPRHSFLNVCHCDGNGLLLCWGTWCSAISLDVRL